MHIIISNKNWNGTLLDDASITVDAVNIAVLPLMNLQPITLDRYREVFEVPIINNYLKLGVSAEEFQSKSEQISHAFHSTYEPLAAHAHMRIGAKEVLSRLNTKSISSVILSNHTLEGIYLQLERLKITPYFAAVLANDDREQVHHTGKQHRLEKYMKDNNFDPNEVIIVGDTSEEVLIGNNLGLRSIAVTGGFSSKVRLVAAKPDYLVSSVKQVVNIVEGIA